MVVDIGGGTTDIAVLSLNGIATSSSIKVAGDTFDEAVAAYMRKRYGMLIGLNTAEEVKITIGCVYERPQEVSMLVKGRDFRLFTDMPPHAGRRSRFALPASVHGCLCRHCRECRWKRLCLSHLWWTWKTSSPI